MGSMTGGLLLILLWISSLAYSTRGCAQYQFEPDCKTCHCDGPPCDRKTGICPSGICLPGWTGPSCSQGDNIALKKPVRASSVFSSKPEWETSHVVDGKNGTTSKSAGLCTATNGGGHTEWIQVDLGQQFPIGRIVVYGRMDMPNHEFNGLEISISMDSTNYNRLYVEPHVVIDIDYLLTSPHVARYVRLQQSDAQTLPLTVCELQVFPGECGSGTFGELCDNRCHCSGQPCNTINGHCPSGKCLPGYHLDTCSQPCPDYYYGNCTSRCGQCRNAASCDRVTGMCPAGGLCEPGYTRGNCQEVCRHGRYGVDCQEPCGKCRQNATCHHINGTCQNGCAPGYRGIDCTRECIGGTFGDSCKGICRCLDTRICNPETGYCPGGQCSAGYRGLSCDEECQGGTFGLNCNKTCGQCKDNEPCEHRTGNCRHGCDPGYQGSGCSEKQTKTPENPASSQNMVVIVMAVVISILVVVLVAIAVCYFWRRRRTSTQSSSETPATSQTTSDPTRTQTHQEGTEQNTYDDLIRTQASPEGAKQNTYDDLLQTHTLQEGTEQKTYEDLIRTHTRPGGAEQDYTELTEVGVYTNTSGATQIKQPEIYQNV